MSSCLLTYFDRKKPISTWLTLWNVKYHLPTAKPRGSTIGLSLPWFGILSERMIWPVAKHQWPKTPLIPFNRPCCPSKMAFGFSLWKWRWKDFKRSYREFISCGSPNPPLLYVFPFTCDQAWTLTLRPAERLAGVLSNTLVLYRALIPPLRPHWMLHISWNRLSSCVRIGFQNGRTKYLTHF